MEDDTLKTRIKDQLLTFNLVLILLLLSVSILFSPTISTDSETYTVLDITLGDYGNRLLFGDFKEFVIFGVSPLVISVACFLFWILSPKDIRNSCALAGITGSLYIISFIILCIELPNAIDIYDSATTNDSYLELIFNSNNLTTYTSSVDLFIACFVLNVISFLSFWLSMTTEKYSGPPLMSLKQKLLEIPIQLALIPVSAIISLLSFTIVFLWIPYLLIDRIWFKKLKPTIYYGESYNVGERYYDVKNKVSHDIKDKDGNVIGSFDTTETERKYDSGNRYWGIYSSTTFALAFFALPLRIVSFISSLFAPFIRKLYIHVRDLGLSTMTYDAKSFALLDLIVTK